MTRAILAALRVALLGREGSTLLNMAGFRAVTSVCGVDDMDVEDYLILALILLWVRPLLIERRNKGLFHTLFDDQQEDNEKFFTYFLYYYI